MITKNWLLCILGLLIFLPTIPMIKHGTRATSAKKQSKQKQQTTQPETHTRDQQSVAYLKQQAATLLTGAIMPLPTTKWLRIIRDLPKQFHYLVVLADIKIPAEKANVDPFKVFVLLYEGLSLNEQQNIIKDSIVKAAYQGDIDFLRYAQTYQMSLTKKNYKDQTALSVAIAGGHLETVKFLHNHGFQLNDCYDQQHNMSYLEFTIHVLSNHEYKTVLSPNPEGLLDIIRFYHDNNIKPNPRYLLPKIENLFDQHKLWPDIRMPKPVSAVDAVTPDAREHSNEEQLPNATNTDIQTPASDDYTPMQSAHPITTHKPDAATLGCPAPISAVLDTPEEEEEKKHAQEASCVANALTLPSSSTATESPITPAVTTPQEEAAPSKSVAVQQARNTGLKALATLFASASPDSSPTISVAHASTQSQSPHHTAMHHHLLTPHQAPPSPLLLPVALCAHEPHPALDPHNISSILKRLDNRKQIIISRFAMRFTPELLCAFFKNQHRTSLQTQQFIRNIFPTPIKPALFIDGYTRTYQEPAHVPKDLNLPEEKAPRCACLDYLEIDDPTYSCECSQTHLIIIEKTPIKYTARTLIELYRNHITQYPYSTHSDEEHTS